MQINTYISQNIVTKNTIPDKYNNQSDRLTILCGVLDFSGDEIQPHPPYRAPSPISGRDGEGFFHTSFLISTTTKAIA
ncbi:hypothetical protein [Calothrix sp. 336/3]|uniref:hypothetical protein n=1 Tax=Calothrix sp. 336/3 TaxID=1337936 RepID=UPI000AAD012F|nr:hypothetical protein [Calothrix sp. 336/3]